MTKQHKTHDSDIHFAEFSDEVYDVIKKISKNLDGKTDQKSVTKALSVALSLGYSLSDIYNKTHSPEFQIKTNDGRVFEINMNQLMDVN